MLTHVLQSYSHVRLRAAPTDLLFGPIHTVIMLLYQMKHVMMIKTFSEVCKARIVNLRSLVIA